MKAIACILVATLASVWASASASALEITFDDLTSIANPVVVPPLDTHGYRFTSAIAFQTIDTPGATFVSDGSGVYLGQVLAAPGITMTRVDGAPFALYDFTAAEPARLRRVEKVAQLHIPVEEFGHPARLEFRPFRID